MKNVYVSLKKDLKVKVSSLALGGNFDTYYMDFGAGNGLYVPKNDLEDRLLDRRVKFNKDIVPIAVSSIKEIIKTLEGASNNMEDVVSSAAKESAKNIKKGKEKKQ